MKRIKTRQDWHARKISFGAAIIATALSLALGIFLGSNWQRFGQIFLPQLSPDQNWSELNEVYSALSSHYDGDLDNNNLLDGAKKGLVAAVGDQYTEYMNAEEADAFQKSLHGDVGAGIGVELAKRGDYVRVIRTLPNNPARKAGLLAGDIFYKVNDQEVYQLSADAVAHKIRGEAGSKVTVTMVRDGQEKTFTLTRERINNVSAYVDYKDHTAILTVTRFDTDTGNIIEDFTKEFTDKKITKVILDLRGNGGGYVSAARDLLSLWLDGQKIVTQKSKLSNNEDSFTKRGAATLAQFKTIVLVNDATASASEIVAGALQDYHKATIVGNTTYGKGVVQTMLNLNAGAILKVTTARWYTPHGTNITGTGIKPDVKITNSYEDTNAGRDPQLDKALSL